MVTSSGIDKAATRCECADRKKVQTLDVVIVGMGVCGTALAALLGEAGVSVALVGKRSEAEGYEVAHSASFLPYFSLISSIDNKSGNFLKVESPGGRSIDLLEIRKYLSFFSLPQLESHFADRAMLAGVRVYRGKNIELWQERGCWSVHTDNHRINCRLIVGADGWDSAVRKAVNLTFDQKDLLLGVGCVARIEEESGVKIRLYDKGRICRILKYGSRANIGVFGSCEDMVALRRILDKVLRSDMAALNSVSYPWTAFVPSPAMPQFYTLPCAGKNWILIGEAAGHIHPLSGESLYYALRSVQLAALAVKCGDLRVFDGLWRDEYGKELEAAVKIKTKINKWPRASEWAFAAASRSSRFRGLISNMLLANCGSV
ncbi:MAG: NAD(P)/FAD-dependent oxidoreductase [Chitinispirillales bacterium]|nr:NAD(P)/FAD-dependent oxidoreductase [Chitinispirillales bacterium]